MKVGDQVQVEYGGKWFTATVTEVYTGSIRARFRDERQYPPEPNEWFLLGPMVRPVPGATPPRTAAPSAPKEVTHSNPVTAPSSPAPAPTAPPNSGAGATKFKVGDEVQAICMGARQDAEIAAVENGRYRESSG